MNITSQQIKNASRVLTDALAAFYRPEPTTVSQWANDNFYMSGESSSNPGKWESLPFQVAILNSFGDDRIRVVNLVKSARVGYSQMLKAAMCYLLEHKSRNVLMFQPTNTAAQSFMKTHIDPAVRDVPVMRNIAPWFGKRNNPQSTMTAKVFSNGKQFYCLGGEASANYRERTVDAVFYDELANFPADVQGEGSPTSLGDKRTEVSVFRKSIRGSTPKIKDLCQIERASEESTARFFLEIPCPHCGGFQKLEWGGRDAEFGFKWIERDPNSVKYLCKHCATLLSQEEAWEAQPEGVWRCEDSGYSTRDGETYYLEGEEVDPPEKITWNVWTAYSPLTTWRAIVEDFILSIGDIGRLKTFTNTTLGQPWEEPGQRMEPSELMKRCEVYPEGVDVPGGGLVLTAGADVQKDRIECLVMAWGRGDESFAVDFRIFRGDPTKRAVWDELDFYLTSKFRHETGHLLNIETALIDSGYESRSVYMFTKPRQGRGIYALKGSSVFGDPIIKARPSENNQARAAVWLVGGEATKDSIHAMLNTQDPGPGYMHFPIKPCFDEEFFTQICAEKRIAKMVNGHRVYKWTNVRPNKRNEALDIVCYSLAALHVLNPDLARRHSVLNAVEEPPKPPLTPSQSIMQQRRLARQRRPGHRGR